MHFTSPTRGTLSVREMIGNIQSYMQEDAEASYKLVIGTDSHTTKRETVLVTALIIHRIGKGARFYFRRERLRPLFDLTRRIYRETEASLTLVETLQQQGFAQLLSQWPLEIHVDIGQEGETKRLIQEIKGWVTSAGLTVKIKPESFGASSVADRFTD